MDDQLDNDLKKRIREVFDNYQDDSADESWLELRKKFPEEESKRRAFAWMWWGAAALILLFLSVGLWIYNQGTEPVKFANKTIKHLTQPSPIEKNLSDTIDKIAMADKNKPAELSTNNTVPKQINAANKTGPNALAKKRISIAVQHENKIAAKSDKIDEMPVQQHSGKSFSTQKPPLQNNNVGRMLIAQNKPNSSGTTITEKTEPIAAVTTHPALKQTDSTIMKKEHVKSIEKMFAEDDDKKNQKKNEDKSKDETKKVRFGVYAATYFNYAKGSSNQINAGAGFTSDIKITRNLKLVTGVSVGQNTLNYAGSPPPAAATTFALAAAPKASTALYSASSPTFKGYNASLVGLDIPLNLKYEFNPEKSETYFSAGLSSGTFINESYTYQYNYPALFSSGEQTKGQTNSSSFDNFYFAKTLNLAFGVGYPLGKNHIVIEPFLKYPLDGLGAQQIRFGEGGINLKFSFSKK